MHSKHKINKNKNKVYCLNDFYYVKRVTTYYMIKVQYWNTQWGYCADLFAQRFYASVLCAALVFGFLLCFNEISHLEHSLLTLRFSMTLLLNLNIAQPFLVKHPPVLCLWALGVCFLLTARAVTWTLLIKVLGKTFLFYQQQVVGLYTKFKNGICRPQKWQ